MTMPRLDPVMDPLAQYLRQQNDLSLTPRQRSGQRPGRQEQDLATGSPGWRQRRDYLEALEKMLASQRLRDGSERPIFDRERSMLPAMEIRADAPQAFEAGVARSMSPALERGAPPAVTARVPGLGESLLDAGWVTGGALYDTGGRLAEGFLKSFGQPPLTQAGNEVMRSREAMREWTAPRTGLGKAVQVPAEMASSALPYVAAGGGLPGMLRSGAMTALESRAKDGSLVEGLAKMTGSETLQELADSPYKTAADVGFDLATNAIPGVPQLARRLGAGVGDAAAAATTSTRAVRGFNRGGELEHVVQSAEDPVARLFIENRNQSTRPGYLSPLDPSDLVGRRVTLRNGGKTGYVITPDGDLQNLFNNGAPKGAALPLIVDGIKRGGRTLDAFDGFLPDLYRQYGFVETGRVPFNPEYAPPGWDFARDGTPDVVFMALEEVIPESVIRERHLNPANRVANAPTTNRFTDYDDAAAANQEAARVFSQRRRAGGMDGTRQATPNDAAGSLAGSQAGRSARLSVNAPLFIDEATARLAGLSGGARQFGRNAMQVLGEGAAQLRQRPGETAAMLGLIGAEGLAPGLSAAGGLPFMAGSTGRAPVERWTPTSRGIFDRDVPDMQGTLPPDPRLDIAQYGTDRQQLSPLVEAIVDSPRAVSRVLDEDAERGMIMGGPEWYNLSPIRAFLEARYGMPSFRDWNTMSAAASQSNSVPGEISASSIIAFAKANGLSLEEAKAVARRMFGSESEPGKLPLIYGSHQNIGEQGIERGNIILPADVQSEAWKIPGYEHGRAGGGSVDRRVAGSFPALDRHERYRIMQAVARNPRLKKLALELGMDLEDQLPLRNVKDYRAISDLYNAGARRFGLPTANAYQAARWTGGFDATGLKSPPYGDFVQALEDMILYNAQRRRMKTDPRSLQNFAENVFRGTDMLMPWTGSGPIPIR